MYLNRLACHTPIIRGSYRAGIRMASTIVGKSGRLYVQGEVLQRHRDFKFSVFKAESDNQSFVFKRVPRPFYGLSHSLATEFIGSRNLRMPVDYNDGEDILIYAYYRDTLLRLIQEDPNFPPVERKKILRRVGEAIHELHSKDWIHSDIKPDNILVNWTYDQEGNKFVTDIALGDFDIAFYSRSGEPLRTPYAIGNVMWRSPEGQTGCVTKASDIYSFGLVCIYTLGGGDILLLNDYQELVKNGVSPEQEILTRHFLYFGPVTEGLLGQVNNENWCKALEAASKFSEDIAKEEPEQRFTEWGKELGPEAVNMISGMVNPDPTARTTIDQVLTHQFWQEDT